MKFALFAAFFVVIACACLCWFDLRAGPVVDLGSGRVASVTDLGAQLDEVEARGTRAEAGRGEPAPLLAQALLDDDLIELLRATARAWLEHDATGLESRLERLLGEATAPRRVLDLVRQGRLPAGSLEDDGAILSIGFAAGSEARRAALTVDGRPFTREFLEALAELEAERAEPLAEFAASLVVAGRAAIGARWLGTIATLRDGFPDHASNFDPLVRAVLAGGEALPPAEEDASELARIVSTSQDPLTVQAALSVLLSTDPGGLLPVAEELCRRSPRSSALALAVADAIARHAPVGEAAASLTRVASPAQLASFTKLGAREGGREAAAREYSALVAANQNPLGRRLLVAALCGEPQAVLLGIAETDPEPAVRQQALLSLTTRPTDGPAVMQAVRARHAARDDARVGMSTRAALSVAENVVLNGSPVARAEAVRWFRDVVLDPAERLEDRQLAWSKLVRQARPEELVGIEEPR